MLQKVEIGRARPGIHNFSPESRTFGHPQRKKIIGAWETMKEWQISKSSPKMHMPLDFKKRDKVALQRKL